VFDPFFTAKPEKEGTDLGSRNEISYPFGGISELATCGDVNFARFVVPLRLLGLAVAQTIIHAITGFLAVSSGFGDRVMIKWCGLGVAG
jgi:hypothetical protein